MATKIGVRRLLTDRKRYLALLTGCLLIYTPGCQQDQQHAAAISGGRADFQAYCASCHGREAHGDGPVASRLQTRPPDLTRLSARYEGEFPKEYVRGTIDGGEELLAHGSRTMPVWGRIWRSQDDPASNAEAERILDELIEYLQSIQEPI